MERVAGDEWMVPSVLTGAQIHKRPVSVSVRPNPMDEGTGSNLVPISVTLPFILDGHDGTATICNKETRKG